ncbi:hypothetical protein EV356DRAFT_509326 [Viridothelium virens]|uniref:DUF6594 domain-containing protein n=1 Tax=Viridothelium virens TaxID=1048519 RepID=A0A6A6GX29_VIRVR|nr:hypothetical protein EV356DRAFT_509326 [Viridothelium virens]
MIQPDNEIQRTSDKNAKNFQSIPKAEVGMAGTSQSHSKQASDSSLDTFDELPYGYPALAEYHGSEDRNLVFRRFRHLQARLILEKQDQIRQLEEEIRWYDSEDKAKDLHEPSPRRIETRYRHDIDEAKNRLELFDRAEREFIEYERLLSAAHHLATLERPFEYEYKNVLEHILTTKPVTKPEVAYIDDLKDLITLRRPGAHAHIGGLVELALNHIKIATQKNGGNVTMQKWVEENGESERLAGKFIATVMFLLVPPLFVVPIYALSEVGNNIGKSIGILVAFALTFTGLLLLEGSAKQHEVLSSSAAYLAVLVVFFGSLGNNNASPSG